MYGMTIFSNLFLVAVTITRCHQSALPSERVAIV
jgi:hypothetical protein